jgi:hypothetical protein
LAITRTRQRAGQAALALLQGARVMEKRIRLKRLTGSGLRSTLATRKAPCIEDTMKPATSSMSLPARGPPGQALLDDRPTTVDGERCARDHRGCARGQEHNGLGNVFRLADSSERDAIEQGLQ